jgi:hypothetical protein
MKYLIIAMLLILSFNSCKKEISEPISTTQTTVDEDLYNDTNSTGFEIINATIDLNKINITISSSGCDGDSWVVGLIDSEAIAESNPVQKYFKIKFTNTELCHSIVAKTFSFDLNPSFIDDDFYMNLEGWKGPLLYTE